MRQPLSGAQVDGSHAIRWMPDDFELLSELASEKTSLSDAAPARHPATDLAWKVRWSPEDAGLKISFSGLRREFHLSLQINPSLFHPEAIVELMDGGTCVRT